MTTTIQQLRDMACRDACRAAEPDWIVSDLCRSLGPEDTEYKDGWYAAFEAIAMWFVDWAADLPGDELDIDDWLEIEAHAEYFAEQTLTSRDDIASILATERRLPR